MRPPINLVVLVLLVAASFGCGYAVSAHDMPLAVSAASGALTYFLFMVLLAPINSRLDRELRDMRKAERSDQNVTTQ